jgi:hypothetical protein
LIGFTGNWLLFYVDMQGKNPCANMFGEDDAKHVWSYVMRKVGTKAKEAL